MNSVVCLKQVPDTETVIKINPEKTGIVTEGVKFVANPYDEYAVEEALKLKEKFGDGKVTVITMGPDRIMESMRTFLAMGADEGIHLKDNAFMEADCYATARTLAAAIRTLSYDIILMGRIAIDDQSMQVAGYLSEMLNLPLVQVVTKLEVADDKKSALATRQIEGGNEVVEVRLPAIITAQKGLNEPRYASLPGIMKARKKPVIVKTAADLGLEADSAGLAGSKTRVVFMSLPPERARGKILEGEPAEAAQKLAKALREEAKVI